MKFSVTYTLAVTMAAGAAAHQHNHRHLHSKKEATKVDKRAPDVVTKVVVDATQTVYQLGNDILDEKKAKAGLKDGEFVVIGESTPTYTPPPPKPTTSKDLGAQFLESKTSSTPPPPPPTTTSKPPPPPPKPTVKAPPKPKPPVAQSNSLSGGATGLDADFPSGKVKCSEFPSKYGAVAANWLGLDGYTGIQRVPGFTLGSSLSISKIITGVFGESCTSFAMCSYMCPPGYQKAQWSTAQGATKQSVGGLYCNGDGYLELTSDTHKTLCIKGEGGVSIQNDLNVQVCTCRTDYPGTEAMTIDTCAGAGESVQVTNPNQQSYYQWTGLATSAQYYINPKGLGPKDACVWNSPAAPGRAGNWAPTILGVGKAADGITYISIFQNLPTSHAKLDFNIEVTGDVSSKCGYKNGQYIGGDTGCTTGLRAGGKAVIRYY